MDGKVVATIKCYGAICVDLDEFIYIFVTSWVTSYFVFNKSPTSMLAMNFFIGKLVHKTSCPVLIYSTVYCIYKNWQFEIFTFNYSKIMLKIVSLGTKFVTSLDKKISAIT